MAPSIFAVSPIEGVSDRYSFLPTIKIVERMRQAGWNPVAASEQRVRLPGRVGFQKHILRFQRADAKAVRGEYTAEVGLLNSHDRSSAYVLPVGLYRWICSNGMTVSDSEVGRISLRHAGFYPEQVIEASGKVLENIPAVIQSVESFRAKTLTEIEQRAFAEAAIILRNDDLKTAPVGPELVLRARRTEDTGADLWHTLNRVQENIIKGGQKDWKRRDEDGKRARRTRAVTGLDQDLKLNKALWHLAKVLREGGAPSEAIASLPVEHNN